MVMKPVDIIRGLVAGDSKARDEADELIRRLDIGAARARADRRIKDRVFDLLVGFLLSKDISLHEAHGATHHQLEYFDWKVETREEERIAAYVIEKHCNTRLRLQHKFLNCERVLFPAIEAIIESEWKAA